jgi:hypothetical protein
LERSFRRVHLARSRVQIGRNLLLGPVFVLALILVHSRLYQRWYPIVCPYGAAFPDRNDWTM